MVTAVAWVVAGGYMWRVYVLSNQATGNSVMVFDRAADGRLTPGGTFPTGGLGTDGVTNPLDPLTSQGSLALSESHRFLFAVDAGSNEVSVLAVDDEKLTPVDRVASGGAVPVSVTIRHNLVYVLHRGDPTVGDANVTGFTVDPDGKLSSLSGSTQMLVGGPNDFPARVGFTPDGTHLVVTETGNNRDREQPGRPAPDRRRRLRRTTGQERIQWRRAVRLHLRQARRPNRLRGGRQRDVILSPRSRRPAYGHQRIGAHNAGSSVLGGHQQHRRPALRLRLERGQWLDLRLPHRQRGGPEPAGSQRSDRCHGRLPGCHRQCRERRLKVPVRRHRGLQRDRRGTGDLQRNEHQRVPDRTRRQPHPLPAVQGLAPGTQGIVAV